VSADTTRVLVVEDDATMRGTLVQLLATKGYDVDVASSGIAGAALVEERSYDVVLSDVRMPDLDGLQLLRIVKEVEPRTAVVMLTGYGTIESAVQAIRDGAYHYMTKPFHPEEIFALLHRIEELKGLRQANEELRQQLAERLAGVDMVGTHPSMLRVSQLVEAVAAHDTTVLVTGESGTGKELVARAIHQRSARAERELAIVDCTTLASELLENELFGHEPGAFTDAGEATEGKLQAADGGTVFLDEIGSLDPRLQQKLLRFLQEHQFTKLGSSKPIRVDVRVIAATNADLEAQVQAGQFRQDLYYRLNVLHLHLPPLRERRSDIPALARHFLERYRGRRALRLEHEALAALESYGWPGNVRELENAIERASVLAAEDTIQLDDLPPAVTSRAAPEAPAGKTLKEQLDAYERELLLEALNGTAWNRSRAAQSLGINRTTLLAKMAKHQL